MLLHPTLDTLLATKPRSKLEYHFRFRAANGRQSYRFNRALDTLTILTSKSGPPLTIAQISSEDPTKLAGPQIISLITSASPARLRKIFAESTALAAQHGLEFLGVGCHPPQPNEPHDWATPKTWPTLDQITWILRHWASVGELELGATQIELLFPFDGEPDTLTALNHTLTAGAIKTKFASDLLFARIACLTDDDTISAHYAKMHQAAADAGAHLKGLQVWNPELDW